MHKSIQAIDDILRIYSRLRSLHFFSILLPIFSFRTEMSSSHTRRFFSFRGIFSHRFSFRLSESQPFFSLDRKGKKVPNTHRHRHTREKKRPLFSEEQKWVRDQIAPDCFSFVCAGLYSWKKKFSFAYVLRREKQKHPHTQSTGLVLSP